jgi:hypothetical protein
MPRYLVIDNPFFDNVQLHPVGSEVEWDGPPGKSLEPVGSARKSVTEAPVFPDAKAGRGDKPKPAAKVDETDKGKA